MNTNPIKNTENPKKRGSRIIGGIIILLIILFFAIEFFIGEEQQFPPTSVTTILLSLLQIIVLLLFLILLFVLGRNLTKLYLERKRKVIGAHFKTKLVLFFIALSFIPTLLLFLFASDLISRNIEQWFKAPLDKIMDDTKSLADGFHMNTKNITLHYARQLSKAIKKENLMNPESRSYLREFTLNKLREYKLDEIIWTRTAAKDESTPPLIPNTTPWAPAFSTLSLIQLLIRSAVFIFPPPVTAYR